MKTIAGVAAIIIKDGQVFATQRGYGEWQGWWEFPGGKMEAGESPQDALKREIREELDAEIEVGELLDKIERHVTDERTALVLEGGGLRGVFTCGVLDCFMDHGIRFPLTVGVSAGACNGLSYMSGQRGRARSSNIDLMEKYHYVGPRYLLTQGCIMDFKLLFEDFPEKIIPYDYDAYFSNPDRFVMTSS